MLITKSSIRARMLVQNQNLQSGSPSTLKTPSPQDLPLFLPWACNHLNLPHTMLVKKQLLDDPTLKLKTAISFRNLALSNTFSATLEREKTNLALDVPPNTPIVQVTAFYSNEQLLQLKFEKNSRVPRSALQLIALILKFHPYLQYISVNSGLDAFCVYEISQFLPLSNITDVVLDGSFVKEANYYILLEKPNILKQLSLSKCMINDKAVETIAAKLVYPLPASKTLSILNLSCNRITNVGAKYLAQALRSNRQLSYLNLASNMIDDEGAEDILSILMEFPLSKEEVLDSKRRLVTYLKNRQPVIYETINSLKTTEQGKRPRTKSKKISAKDKLDRETSDMFVEDADESYYARAKSIAIDKIGDFQDPFKTTVYKNDRFYCSGNNGLAYLNLAYNNIRYSSINKLLAVLKHQKSLERRPKGLVKVCVEGNPLPNECPELTQINNILEAGFRTIIDKNPHVNKRRLSMKKI